MKRGVTIILAALGLLLSLGLLKLWRPASTTGGPPPALQGVATLNHLGGQGLNGSLQEAVTAARYGFYQEPKRGGAWLAYNPAQRLSARLALDGLQVVTGGDERRAQRLGMKLRSVGYGERQMAAKADRLTASGAARTSLRHSTLRDCNRLAYRSAWTAKDGRSRNILTERLWRTVKYEEVYLHDYGNPKEARRGIGGYFDFYNHRRLHQSLDYQTPAEVYFQTAAARQKQTAVIESTLAAKGKGATLNGALFLS